MKNSGYELAPSSLGLGQRGLATKGCGDAGSDFGVFGGLKEV